MRAHEIGWQFIYFMVPWTVELATIGRMAKDPEVSNQLESTPEFMSTLMATVLAMPPSFPSEVSGGSVRTIKGFNTEFVEDSKRVC